MPSGCEKYSRVFRKNKNVPIIIISNSITPKARRYGPFQASFMRLKFVTSICDLDLSEDRLIATLRGCILRRLGCVSLPSKSDPPSSLVFPFPTIPIESALGLIQSLIVRGVVPLQLGPTRLLV